MIRWSDGRTMLAGGGAALAYSYLSAGPYAREAKLLGWALLGVGIAAWSKTHDLWKHPELMNGHFMTGGKASAISGIPGDLARVRRQVRRRVGAVIT